MESKSLRFVYYKNSLSAFFAAECSVMDNFSSGNIADIGRSIFYLFWISEVWNYNEVRKWYDEWTRKKVMICWLCRNQCGKCFRARFEHSHSNMNLLKVSCYLLTDYYYNYYLWAAGGKGDGVGKWTHSTCVLFRFHRNCSDCRFNFITFQINICFLPVFLPTLHSRDLQSILLFL